MKGCKVSYYWVYLVAFYLLKRSSGSSQVVKSTTPFNIQYNDGCSNVVVDPLSRMELKSRVKYNSQPPKGYFQSRSWFRIHGNNLQPLSLCVLWNSPSAVLMIQSTFDVSTGKLRPIRSTAKLIADRIIWKNIRHYVKRWPKHCLNFNPARSTETTEAQSHGFRCPTNVSATPIWIF